MNIVVLAGGISSERDVSLTTGKMVANSLKKKGHKVCLLDVFFGYDKEIRDISELFTSDVDENCNSSITEINPDVSKIRKQRGGKGFFGKNVLEICQFADIAFLALHGEDGENGKLQAAFDLFEIKYTGTGSIGSALAMNKHMAKQMFVVNNIKTPNYKLIRKNENYDINGFSFPCVVKPCSGGSSIGVSIVNSPDEFDSAVKSSLAFENEVMVEEYIKGREFSIGIIDGEALPPIEIIPKEGFYDYVNKYQADKTVEICPAEITKEENEAMAEAAKAVYRALHLEVYSRIDFLLDEKGDLYCLEANTLPGMTPISLMPQEALAVGMDHADLCQLIIDKSLKKYE